MNDTKRTFAKNAGFLMASQLITWALAILLTIFLPRYLGVVNMGILRLAISIWAIVGIIIVFGTDILLTKEIARDRTKTSELISTSIISRIFLFFVCAVLVAIYSKIAGYSYELIKIITIIGVSTFFVQVAGPFQAGFQGFERMEFNSLSDILSKAVTTIVTIVLLFLGYRLAMVALVLTLGSIISLIYLYLSLRKLYPLHFEFNWSKAFWILKMGFPYLLVSGFLVLYTQVDIVILSLILNEESIGWYGTASTLFGTFMFIPTVFITAIFPILSRAYTDSSDSLLKLIQKSFDLLLLLGVPIGLGISVISSPIVILLYGKEFANSGPILALMGIVLIFTYQNTLLGRYFISIDRQNTWTIIMAVATVVTIPLDLVLVPLNQKLFGNGALGGAISFIITELGMLVVGILLLPRGTLGMRNVWVAARTLLAGLLMAAVADRLKNTFILIPIISGAATYLVMILLLRVVPKEDWTLIRLTTENLLSRFRKRKPEFPVP